MGDACVSLCGDGNFSPSVEDCDDGNLVSGDGCDSECNIESGYHCYLNDATQRTDCEPICGDGVIYAPET